MLQLPNIYIVYISGLRTICNSRNMHLIITGFITYDTKKATDVLTSIAFGWLFDNVLFGYIYVVE